jgi:hypothetical protein
LIGAGAGGKNAGDQMIMICTYIYLLAGGSLLMNLVMNEMVHEDIFSIVGLNGGQLFSSCPPYALAISKPEVIFFALSQRR